jgi:hypothetical protein
MAATKDHLIGLLLGAEEDWPQAFEQILRFVGPLNADGTEHRLATERLTIEPFDLTDPVRTGLVIDRLAHWYFHPREWLKKAALVNGTYLLNSPFTFQSMEKHSAYCAMIRLGLKVPPTILVPYKNPLDNVRWAYTSAKYNKEFDLDVLAAELGYPLYMKPFDGGGWRGVSRVNDPHDLHTAYDDSGEMLMHLQATVDYEHFARALSIGPETMVMDFRPEEPMHQRYHVSHGFLGESAGKQAGAISRIVNAFFHWEFNSAEMLVAGDEVYPIDYANACPDVAVTSLHYYFPWAITALVKWSAYCLDRSPAQRRPRHEQVLRRRRLRPLLRREAGRLPRPRRRALRDRALPRLVCGAPGSSRRPGPRVGERRRLRPAARRDRPGHLPGTRARAVPRPLSRPARDVGRRPGRRWLRTSFYDRLETPEAAIRARSRAATTAAVRPAASKAP